MDFNLKKVSDLSTLSQCYELFIVLKNWQKCHYRVRWSYILTKYYLNLTCFNKHLKFGVKSFRRLAQDLIMVILWLTPMTPWPYPPAPTTFIPLPEALFETVPVPIVQHFYKLKKLSTYTHNGSSIDIFFQLFFSKIKFLVWKQFTDTQKRIFWGKLHFSFILQS